MDVDIPFAQSTVGMNGSKPSLRVREYNDEYNNRDFQSTGRSPLSAAQLFPAAGQVNPQLDFALNLLSEALAVFTEALDHAKAGTRMQADDAAMRGRAILPELFALTSMEDGFRTIALSCHSALVNLRGALATEVQFAAMATAMAALRRRPFMKYDEALGICESLEDTGLDINFSPLETLATAIVDYDDDNPEFTVSKD